jgi:erythronate-4-phosphate dehydrogenase
MTATQQLNIFIDENIPLLKEALNHCGIITTFKGRDLTKQDLLKGKCTHLFVRSTTKINSELLDGTLVRFVGTATAGCDHIDESYLRENNIGFISAPGANANSVAEYVVYSMLVWAKSRNEALSGKTIGIIGFGNVGKLVFKYASRFGMKILINDPPLLDSGYNFPANCQYADLDYICRNSDVVTNHVPLEANPMNYPTYKLFYSSNLSLLKRNALFLHTSRGGVVDELALINAYQEKELTLAIDVWENEPDFNTELAAAAIIATPHVAGYSSNGKIRGSQAMAAGFDKATGIMPDYSVYQSEKAAYNPLPVDLFSNEEFVLEMLESARRIKSDTAEFKKLIDVGPEERKRLFDLLRKKYPVRRETL